MYGHFPNTTTCWGAPQRKPQPIGAQCRLEAYLPRQALQDQDWSFEGPSLVEDRWPIHRNGGCSTDSDLWTAGPPLFRVVSMPRPSVVLVLLAACGLSACSGDGTVRQTTRGSLDGTDERLSAVDGSYYDDYRFRTKAGYRISVQLRSDSFDPYVHLFDAKRNQLAYNDDVAPGDNTAAIEFSAPYEGDYFVLVNSRDAGETGEYVLEIRVVPP